MPTVLIVDDDKHTRAVLETLFTKSKGYRGLDVTVVVAGDGEEGYEAFQQHAPDVVITDLLMPRVDGFELCQRIRADERGKDVRLLVASGVYRDSAIAQRVRSEYNAKLYAKPYQLKQLAEEVGQYIAPGRFTGTDDAGTETMPAPSPEASGALSDTPVPRVLFDLQEKGATGRLTFKRGRISKVIAFELGHPIWVQSNVREETLGYFLVSRGIIDDETHQAALEQAAADKIRLGRALIEMGKLDGEQLVTMLAAQTQSKITSLLRWPDGEWKFEPRDTPPGQGDPLDIERVVLTGLRDTLDTEDAIARGSALHGHVLKRTERGERMWTRVETFFGATFTDAFLDDCTVAELVERGVDRTEALTTIDVLLTCGILTAPLASSRAKQAGAAVVKFSDGDDEPMGVAALSEKTTDPSPTPDVEQDEGALYGLLFGDNTKSGYTGADPLDIHEPVPEEVVGGESGVIDVSEMDLGAYADSVMVKVPIPRTSEDDQARRALLEEYLRTQGIDLYDVLRVERQATPGEISGALVEANSRFSLEYYSRFDLGRDYPKLEEIRRRYEQARKVLLDDEARAEYDAELAGGQLGPTAPAMDAEILFRAAVGLLDRGRARDAVLKFEKALELAPNEPDYHAELGWARFSGGGRNARAADAARPHINEALRINPDHARAHEYKGAITAALGNDDVEAIFHLERALEADPGRLEPLAVLESIHRRRGELRPLERIYRRLLHRASTKTGGHELRLWLTLAELYKELDELDNARIAYGTAQRLAPDDEAIARGLDEVSRGSAEGFAEASARLRDSWRQVPADPAPALAMFDQALAAGQPDAQFAVASALVTREVDSEVAVEFYRRYRPRFLVRAQRGIDAELFARVRHPSEDDQIGTLFDLIAPAIAEVMPMTFDDLEIDPQMRVPDEEMPPNFDRVRRYIAHVTGVAPPALYVRSDFGHQIHVGAVAPPVLLAGDEALLGAERLELSFRLARAMTYVRPGRALGASRPARVLKAAMLGALTHVLPETQVDDPAGGVAQMRDAVARLPAQTQQSAANLVTQVARRSRSINLSEWARGLSRTADRVGLLLCGDLPSAARFVREAGNSAAVDDLIDFALSPDYLAARVALGLSIDV